MTTPPMIDEVLDKAYIAGLLLTRNAKQAEDAVMEGIRKMEQGSHPEDTLLPGTMEAAVAAKVRLPFAVKVRGRFQIEEQQRVSLLLPRELRPVLSLHDELRRVFVLRVLGGLSREVCARISRIGIRRIDELVSLAAQALAQLSEVGASPSGYIHTEAAYHRDYAAAVFGQW